MLMSFCLLGCNVQSNGETYYSIDKTKTYTQPSTTQEFVGGFVDSVTQTTYPDSWNKRVSTGSYVIVKLKNVQNNQVYPCLLKTSDVYNQVVESCITD
jgi:hypothetical protein